MHAISGVSMPPGSNNDALAVAADTIIAADLAALYLGLTPEVLERMRSDGEAPATIKTEAAGLPPNSTISFYSFEELRHWRNTYSPNEVPQTLSDRDIRFWVGQSVPFWVNANNLIVAPVADPAGADWPQQFLRALSGEMAPRWITRERALEMRWRSPEEQHRLSMRLLECLEHTIATVQQACRESRLNRAVSTNDTTLQRTAPPLGMKKWHLAMRLFGGPAQAMDLRGWIEGVEPFWITETNRIIDSALWHEGTNWDAVSQLASAEEIGLIWLSRLQAVRRGWFNADRQEAFAASLFTLLTEAQKRVRETGFTS